MTGSETFLDKEPLELQDYLLGHARGAQAPGGAQQRALSRLASLSVGAGVTLGASSALGASVVRATPWLIGKWVLVGMSATVLTFSAGEQITRAFTTSANREMSQKVTATAALEPPGAQVPAPGIAEASPAASVSEPSASLASRKLKAALGPRASASVEAAIEPAPAAAPAEASARLDRELSMLKETRAALAAGAPATALGALDAYEQEFPTGVLNIEATALRVEAVAKLGNRALASQLAAEFLKRHGSSPLAPRVRAFADASQDVRTNP